MRQRDALVRGSAVGYLAAWAAGLTVWPSNLPLTASPSSVVASHAAHSGQALSSYALTEGLAGILLGIVVIALPARAARRSGLAAATISLVQCGLGAALVAASQADDTHLAGELFGLLNRLDGLKMLLLALTAAVAAVALHPRRSRLWRVLSLATSGALTLSGIAYLALVEPLAWAAFVSGPLLLVWVTAAGLSAPRLRNRPATQAARPETGLTADVELS